MGQSEFNVRSEPGWYLGQWEATIAELEPPTENHSRGTVPG